MSYRTDKSRRENVRCTNPLPTPPTKHMSMEHTTRVKSWIKLNNSATVKRLLFGKPNDIPVPYANTILYPCSLCILGSLWDTHCIKKDNLFKPFHPHKKDQKVHPTDVVSPRDKECHNSSQPPSPKKKTNKTNTRSWYNVQRQSIKYKVKAGDQIN